MKKIIISGAGGFLRNTLVEMCLKNPNRED